MVITEIPLLKLFALIAHIHVRPAAENLHFQAILFCCFSIKLKAKSKFFLDQNYGEEFLHPMMLFTNLFVKLIENRKESKKREKK